MRGLAVTYNKVVFSPSFSSHEGLGILLQELSLNMRRGLVLSPQERERGREGEREGGRERREGERERGGDIKISQPSVCSRVEPPSNLKDTPE